MNVQFQTFYLMSLNSKIKAAVNQFLLATYSLAGKIWFFLACLHALKHPTHVMEECLHFLCRFIPEGRLSSKLCLNDCSSDFGSLLYDVNYFLETNLWFYWVINRCYLLVYHHFSMTKLYFHSQIYYSLQHLSQDLCLMKVSFCFPWAHS